MDYLKGIYHSAGSSQHQNIHNNNWATTTEVYLARYATWQAFFSRILAPGETYLGLTSDDFARKTMSLLRGDYEFWTSSDPHPDTGLARQTTFNSLIYPSRAASWVKDSPALTVGAGGDRLFLQVYLKKLADLYEGPALLTEGAQSMDRATGIQLLSKIVPNDPDVSTWQTYANTIWDAWWTERDRTFNSSHYDPLWLQDLILWLDGSEAFDSSFSASSYYQDAGVINFAERYLQYLSPTGAVPNYGDSLGVSTVPGKLILFFEKMATETRDGRYKWAAHRIFEWVMTRQNDMLAYGNSRLNLMEELMEAYLYADDTIAEVAPTMSSTLLTRKKFVVDWPTQSGFSLTSTTIPDKIIFRSGWSANDLYGMLELTPSAGHGHSDVGSLNFLSANNSVLLADTPYLVRDHRFHNVFQVITNARGPWGETNGSNRISLADVSVPLFKDSAKGTVAQVEVADYQATGADLDREVFFVKNNFIWVRDKLTTDSPRSAQIGPAWQTIAVSESGSNWADTRLTNLPVAEIWELSNLMTWQNNSHNLLVMFPSLNSTATLTIEDVSQDDTRTQVPGAPVQNTMKYKIWSQRDKTITSAPEIFHSVLVPHSSSASASTLAGGVSVIYDEDDAAVLKTTSLGSATLLLGLNPNGETISLSAGSDYPAFTTDAKSFYFELSAGKVSKYWVTEATQLTASGKSLISSASRTDSSANSVTYPTNIVPNPNPVTSSSGGSRRSGSSGGGGGSVPATSNFGVGGSDPLILPPPVTATFPSLTSLFATYTRGAHVTQLQKMLSVDKFYTGAITGYYDNATIKAVQAFQIKYGIQATGVSGPQTRAKLNQLYANKSTTIAPSSPASFQQLLRLLQQLLLLLQFRQK